VTRAEALATAAGIVAKHVPDLPGLISLFDFADQTRVAAALRARAGGGPAVVGGGAHPPEGLWAEAARRAVE
jgi:8-oxo-dGTP pyrophosphatase MutT (NUDIX family)